MIDSGSNRPYVVTDRLLDLLERWQSLESQGQGVSAASVCSDCPELTEELERLVRFSRQVATLAADTTGRSTDAPDCLPTVDFSAAVTATAPLASRERYTIEAKLGRGGMGTVYRAHDRLLGRTVALKVIRPDALTPGMRARFQAEARAVARLDHPHIVKVFDVGEGPMPDEPSPVPFLTLEFVEGGSLGQRLGRTPLAPAEAARLVAFLARAMQHAHERGIVHRDLKPENVLLALPSSVEALNTSLGCPKITDFGLARQVTAARRLTGPGGVVGTPDYMAPEQADGLENIGPAADVWALGVILYRLLTGSMPFASSSLVELLHQICRAEPVPPEQLRPEVPVELAAIVRDCLRKQPEERPLAGQLAGRLERCLQQTGAEHVAEPSTVAWLPAAGSRPRRRRWLRVGVLAAVAGVALLAGLAWALRPGRTTEERQEEQPGNNTPPVAEKPLRIRSLQVMHFRKDGDKTEPRGPIGDQSFETRWGDEVRLKLELSEDAYFYLIGFNFDGQEQLLWPVDGEGQPSKQLSPPRRQRLHYPGLLCLDDKAKSGLQVYVVAASRQRLPSYAKWCEQRKGVRWKALPAGEMVWGADCTEAWMMKLGVAPEKDKRGSIREIPGNRSGAAGEPPLVELCRALRDGGLEAVEAIAFPVLAKEDK